LSQYSGVEIEMDHQKFLLLRETDILARFLQEE